MTRPVTTRIMLRKAIAGAAFLVLALLVLMSVTACGDPCAGHGSTTGYIGGGVYSCSDGTRQYG